jgi:hypothetical protein
LAGIIPRGSRHHVLLHLRTELHPPVHPAKRRWTRAFISSSDNEDEGF